MIERFNIHVFYSDGKFPESGQQELSTLSEKWIGTARHILKDNGPVFDINMGDTLSHFDIRMAGPILRLYAYNRLCFETSISTGQSTDQDIASCQSFVTSLARICKEAQSIIENDVYLTIKNSETVPTLLMLDLSPPDMDTQQHTALAQLGIHFVAAYYEYVQSELISN